MTMIDDIKRDRKVDTKEARDRREKRIPDMEAALMAAEEMATEIEEYATHKKNGAPHNPRNPEVFAALTAYRKATGAT